MQTSDDVLSDLLDDAKKVVVYGQRTGRLRDSSLAKAIAAASKLTQADWGDKAIIDLQVALNRSIQWIAPTTLADLRSDWDPFGRDEIERDRGFKYAFIAFSLVVMLAAAWYTLQYNAAAAGVVELETIVKENVQQKIGEIVRKVRNSDEELGKIAVGGNSATDGELYFELVDALRLYDKRVKGASSFAVSFLLLSDTPPYILWSMVAPMIGLVSAGNATQYDHCSGLPTPGIPPPTAKDRIIAASGSANLQAASKVEDAARPDNFSVLYQQYRNDTHRILCTANIRTTPFDIPPIEEMTMRTKARINLLALWVLPGLYGALGATIYYMRRILDPTIRDPRIVRIVHRVALGAFSGIIVAWFWSPTAGLYADFAKVGLNLFGVAFIIGFSVDIFFAFLERLVQLGQRWIRQLGSSPPRGDTV
jgi:hypothetical protein